MLKKTVSPYAILALSANIEMKGGVMSHIPMSHFFSKNHQMLADWCYGTPD